MDLDPALYGFTEADLDRSFFLGVWRMSGFLSEQRPVQTLRGILDRLEQARLPPLPIILSYVPAYHMSYHLLAWLKLTLCYLVDR